MLLTSKKAIVVRKWAILTHRWMGVGFCLLFLAWFVSGIVMMYCRYPRVEQDDRLARAAIIPFDRILIAPDAAFAATKSTVRPSQIRLNMLDGRPVYRFAFGRKWTIVFADNGGRLDTVPREMALRIASGWTGSPAASASFQGSVMTDDQWTIDSSVHPYGPFWKFAWPDGEEVYVSQHTGEVVQDTTRASRTGAYFGAIPHWLYFTPLWSHSGLWNQVVIWLSGAGTVMSLLGLIVGLWLYSPSKQFRFPDGPSAIPYAGQKRWHVILGLTFGLVTCTWVFSGLMSMGPFAFVQDENQPNVNGALRGDHVDSGSFGAKHPRIAVADVAASLAVKELELGTFGGESFYLASESPRKSVIVPVRGSTKTAFDTGEIVEAVKGLAPIANVRVVSQYESYYVDRQNRLPLPVLCVEFKDSSQAAYYIDPRTGRVVESYGSRSRWDRWLYHGLHSFDLPWLYAHRPLWDILVLLLMIGGTALSVTSIIIAGRRIRRKFLPRHRVSAERAQPIEV